jgi:hypothetical protein
LNDARAGNKLFTVYCLLFTVFIVGREMGRRWKALDAETRQQYKDEYTRLRGDQQARKQVGRHQFEVSVSDPDWIRIQLSFGNPGPLAGSKDQQKVKKILWRAEVSYVGSSEVLHGGLRNKNNHIDFLSKKLELLLTNFFKTIFSNQKPRSGYGIGINQMPESGSGFGFREYGTNPRHRFKAFKISGLDSFLIFCKA